MIKVNLGAPPVPESVSLPEGTGASNVMGSASSLASMGSQFGPYGAAAGAVLGTVLGLVKTRKQRDELDAKALADQKKYSADLSMLNQDGASLANANAAGTGYFNNLMLNRTGGKLLMTGGDIAKHENLDEDLQDLILKISIDVASKRITTKVEGEDDSEEFGDCGCGCKLLKGGKCGCGCKLEEGGDIPKEKKKKFTASYQEGGILGVSFDKWKESLPDNLKGEDPNLYDFESAYELGMEPEYQEKDGLYHLPSRDPKTGRMLKTSKHPTFVDSIYENIEEGYLPYKNKQGEIFTFPEGDAPSDFEALDLENMGIDKFRDGGSMNVIPKGVLHAHKNNLGDKGLPVVVREEGGSLKKIAEIEREEIIFTIDVTLFLEKYAKKLESGDITKDELLEVGKRLRDEVRNNTIDFTEKMITDEEN